MDERVVALLEERAMLREQTEMELLHVQQSWQKRLEQVEKERDSAEAQAKAALHAERLSDARARVNAEMVTQLRAALDASEATVEAAAEAAAASHADYRRFGETTLVGKGGERRRARPPSAFPEPAEPPRDLTLEPCRPVVTVAS